MSCATSKVRIEITSPSDERVVYEVACSDVQLNVDRAAGGADSLPSILGLGGEASRVRIEWSTATLRMEGLREAKTALVPVRAPAVCLSDVEGLVLNAVRERLRNGLLTVRGLAVSTGWSQPYLSNILNGKRRPSMELLDSLLLELRLDLRKLVSP